MYDRTFSRLMNKKMIEVSMIRIVEVLVYLPEQEADQIIDRMKQTVKEIREEKYNA